MTDQEVMTVLPRELRLGAPPTMPQARSYLFRQQSTLSTYNPDDQIQINIPRLQRSYLSKDSYLQFRLNGQYQADLKTISSTAASGNTSAVTLAQYCPDLLLDDSGAWGLFERIEVFDYLGSTVLETIDGLPQLMSLLLDLGTEFTDADHQGQIANGLMSQFVSSNIRDNSRYYTVESTADITVDGNYFSASNNKLYVVIDGVTSTFTITVSAVPAGNNAMSNTCALINSAVDADGKFLHQYGISAIPIGLNKIRLISKNVQFTIATGTNSAHTKLALPLTASTPTQEVVTTSAGIGLPFYQGGLPLVTTGVTTSNGKYDFSFQFSIPLPSFLGFLSKKMVPLHNGFTIVLTVANKYKPIFAAAKQTPVTSFIESDPSGQFAPINDNLTSAATAYSINNAEPLFGASFNINGPRNSAGASQFNDPLLFWWQLTDVMLVCQVLELGPVAESMILSSTQGEPLIVHSKQMRYYRGSSTKAQAEFYLPLNLNVASLTNVLWFMRPDGIENDLLYQSCGSRHRNFLQRWEFQYGSTVLPQSQGIQAMFMTAAQPSSGNAFATTTVGIASGFTECFSELMKARPSNSARGRMSYWQYGSTTTPGVGSYFSFAQTPYKTIDSAGTPTGSQCKFACGLNLELSPGKPDLISGLNTNGMNTQIRGYFHPNYLNDANKLNVAIDAYAEYDAFINVSPGIATTVSF